MSFVTFAQNKDAIAFKSQVEETLAGKVVQVLEGLKAIVAQSMFEEGGVSGGVSSVKKKPSPPAAGTVELPSKENKVKEGGLTNAGRSGSSDGEKTGEFVLPGQKKTNEELEEEKGSDKNFFKGVKKILPKKKFDKVTAVQKDKKPTLPAKK